jgi:hypothetical protein
LIRPLAAERGYCAARPNELEPANQPPSVGIFADDLPAGIMLRPRVMNCLLEFEPQSLWHAGRQDIGRAAVNAKCVQLV